MKEIEVMPDFDVCDLTSQITNIMGKWSIHFLDIIGPNWVIYDYDMRVKFVFRFLVDFKDLEMRIKLEDLKLNVIHYIESLKDETTYRDNLVNAAVIEI